MIVAPNGLVAHPSSYRLLFLSFDKITVIVIKRKSGLFPERRRRVVLLWLDVGWAQSLSLNVGGGAYGYLFARDWLIGPPLTPLLPNDFENFAHPRTRQTARCWFNDLLTLFCSRFLTNKFEFKFHFFVWLTLNSRFTRVHFELLFSKNNVELEWHHAIVIAPPLRKNYGGEVQNKDRASRDRSASTRLFNQGERQHHEHRKEVKVLKRKERKTSRDPESPEPR